MMFFAVLAVLACGLLWPQASALAAERPGPPEVAAKIPHNGGLRAPQSKQAGVAAQRQGPPSTANGKKALHGEAWAFGQSSSRRDAIWQQGVPPESLRKHAVRDAGKHAKAVDTAPGIDNALDTAAKAEKKKSSLGVRVDKESSSWREPLPMDATRPDESLPMESRHVVRAFADVEAGDDLSISLGPELILKDEYNERSVNNNQPDSVLGMGMQFKLDF